MKMLTQLVIRQSIAPMERIFLPPNPVPVLGGTRILNHFSFHCGILPFFWINQLQML